MSLCNKSAVKNYDAHIKWVNTFWSRQASWGNSHVFTDIGKNVLKPVEICRLVEIHELSCMTKYINPMEAVDFSWRRHLTEHILSTCLQQSVVCKILHKKMWKCSCTFFMGLWVTKGMVKSLLPLVHIQKVPVSICGPETGQPDSFFLVVFFSPAR
jgi:hypothetical protein